MKHCILVVEDNQLNRELLRDWLEVEGYEVWSAEDLKASYEVFAKCLPEAVLLDIRYDNGPLQARRLIDRLIAAERGDPIPAAEELDVPA